ncbi:hypothetical protein D3C85_593740 [compost metagenome]
MLLPKLRLAVTTGPAACARALSTAPASRCWRCTVMPSTSASKPDRIASRRAAGASWRASSMNRPCCFLASVSAESMLRPSSATLSRCPSLAYSSWRDRRSRARMIWSLTRERVDTSWRSSLLAASASPALRKPLTLMADRAAIKALIISSVHAIMRRMVMSFRNCVIRVVPGCSESAYGQRPARSEYLADVAHLTNMSIRPGNISKGTATVLRVYAGPGGRTGPAAPSFNGRRPAPARVRLRRNAGEQSWRCMPARRTARPAIARRWRRACWTH